MKNICIPTPGEIELVEKGYPPEIFASGIAMTCGEVMARLVLYSSRRIDAFNRENVVVGRIAMPIVGLRRSFGAISKSAGLPINLGTAFN